jgi:hypothetical protein
VPLRLHAQCGLSRSKEQAYEVSLRWSWKVIGLWLIIRSAVDLGFFTGTQCKRESSRGPILMETECILADVDIDYCVFAFLLPARREVQEGPERFDFRLATHEARGSYVVLR